MLIGLNRLLTPFYVYLVLATSVAGLLSVEGAHATEVLTYDIHESLFYPVYALPPDANVLNVKLEFYGDSATHPRGSVVEPRFTQFWFRDYKALVAWADDPPNPLPQPVGQGGLVLCTMQVTYANVDDSAWSAANPDPLADAIAPRLIEGFEEAWRAYPTYEVRYMSQPPSFASGIYKYLIITDEAWLDVLEPFIQLKAALGMPVLAVSSQWIERTYAGDSVQQKVWYFLRDAYNRWQPSYLLIAGDTNTVPTWTMRKVSLAGEQETTSDWHYSFLDGDNNGYGDMLPEIIVSRLPATDEGSLVDMLSKIVDYHHMEHGEWTRRVLVIAGEDYWIRKTYMIETMNNFVKDYVPSEMSVTRLYAGYNLTADNIVSEINRGASFATVDAHGDASGFDPFYINEVARLVNRGMLPLFDVFACGVAPYDSGSADYWALAMLKNPAGGAISVLGARSPIFVGTTNLEDGPHLAPYYYLPLLLGKSPPERLSGAQGYLFEGIRLRPFRQGDNYFFDQIIQQGLGWFGNTPARNFFGDPDISLLGFEPRALSLDASGYWSPDGKVRIRVFNANTGVPIAGIVVRVMASEVFYFESSTDPEGVIEFKLPEIVRQPGGVDITAYALNYNTAVTTSLTIGPSPVQTSLGISFTPQTIDIGAIPPGAASITVVLSPAVPVKTILLYQSKSSASGPWNSIGSCQTDSSGMCQLSWQPPETGTYFFKAEFSGDESYSPATAISGPDALVVIPEFSHAEVLWIVAIAVLTTVLTQYSRRDTGRHAS